MPSDDSETLSEKEVVCMRIIWNSDRTIKRIRKAIAFALIGVNVLALNACTESPVILRFETIAPATTNLPSARPLPTLTLEPTPTATPSPVPTTKAEYEEELAKLNIIDGNMIMEASQICTILFKTNDNKYKIAFVVDLVDISTNMTTLYDWFSGEGLFSFNYDMYLEIFNDGSVETIVPVNKSMLDVTFLRLGNPISQYYSFTSFGVEIPLKSELYDLFRENSEISYSKFEYADIYLKYIPKEYRMYGSELIPGDPRYRWTMETFPGPTVSPIPEANTTPAAPVSPN